MPKIDTSPSKSSEAVRTALDSLRENVRNILAAQFGGSNFRGIDIVSQFHIDLKLAWKIIRISKANDPFECVRYLPGLGGWDIFCDAAKQIGIGTELADRTRQSFIQVKELGLADNRNLIHSHRKKITIGYKSDFRGPLLCSDVIFAVQ